MAEQNFGADAGKAVERLLSIIESFKEGSIDRDDILEILKIMKERDSNWIRPSRFVYELCRGLSKSLCSEIMRNLKIATGYGSSQLYNFRTAGAKLSSWNAEKPLPLSIVEFLASKDKPAKAVIENLKIIGGYDYVRFPACKFVIYYGEYRADDRAEANAVYFKTTDKLTATTIEIDKRQAVATNGGKEENETFYTCGGERVRIYDFEPRTTGPLNVKALRGNLHRQL